jgi:hypothetical protein
VGGMLGGLGVREACAWHDHSTVTDLARLRGMSTYTPWGRSPVRVGQQHRDSEEGAPAAYVEAAGNSEVVREQLEGQHSQHARHTIHRSRHLNDRRGGRNRRVALGTCVWDTCQQLGETELAPRRARMHLGAHDERAAATCQQLLQRIHRFLHT